MAVPTLREIRDHIATVLGNVENIGRVQPYQRYSTRQSELRDHYAFKGEIRGWFITRVGFRESNQDGGMRTIINRWRITGYMSWSDEVQSELLFDDLIEQVCDAFREEQYLSGIGAVSWVRELAGIQGEDIGPVMFAGVLCHLARLGLETIHFIEGPGEIMPDPILAQ